MVSGSDAPTMLRRQLKLGGVSLLRHSGLAQPGPICGFDQGAILGLPGNSVGGVEPGDAQKTIIGTQPASFSEFGGGAFRLAVEGIRGGEIGTNQRMCRNIVARLFQPKERFVGARLQQMRLTDLLIPEAKAGITGTELDCSLD